MQIAKFETFTLLYTIILSFFLNSLIVVYVTSVKLSSCKDGVKMQHLDWKLGEAIATLIVACPVPKSLADGYYCSLSKQVLVRFGTS